MAENDPDSRRVST